ncbi:hypothetical protein HD554DRAFT_2042447 [Boletus coccyginus]|nr:hypothetical protein HD554DRAFT_2042447 [Boletus coccyginus]
MMESGGRANRTVYACEQGPSWRVGDKSQFSRLIFGTLPTLDEVLDPPEEVEIREIENFSSGEKGEQEIIDAVHHEMAVASGEVIEIDSDEEDSPDPSITRVQAMALCEQLAGAVKEYGEAEDIFELLKQLCHFRAHLRRREFVNAKQTTLDVYVFAGPDSMHYGHIYCIVEWNGLIPLPSDLLGTTCREVYAFFEFQHTLSAGERPPEVIIMVKQLLEHTAKDGVFTLFSKDSDVAFPCSSFLVIVNRQKCESNNSFTWKIIALSHMLQSTTEPRGELEEATNQGHGALSRFQKHGGKQDLERSNFSGRWIFARWTILVLRLLSQSWRGRMAIHWVQNAAPRSTNEDPWTAIKDLDELVRSTSVSDEQYSTLLGNLGLALWYRFKRLGELSDLEDAISRNIDAVDLTPHGHPHKPNLLNNNLLRSFRAPRGAGCPRGRNSAVQTNLAVPCPSRNVIAARNDERAEHERSVVPPGVDGVGGGGHRSWTRRRV